MKKSIALTLVVALCLALTPFALADAPAEDIEVFGEVDAPVSPAESAGDTGLFVEGVGEPEPQGDAESQAEVSSPAEAPVEQGQPEEATAQAQAVEAVSELPGAETAQDDGAYAVASPEYEAMDAETVAAAEPVDMALGATQLLLGVKEKYTLSAALFPEGSASTMTWRSSKPKIAKVNATTGEITAVKKGSAVIYAKTANGIERSCSVTVKTAPGKITLNTANAILTGSDQAVQLAVTFPKNTGSQVYYSSSDPNVATVDASGLIVTVNPGRATITVRTFNGKSASCAVRVLDPSVPAPSSIQLAANGVSIGVKQSFALNPVFVTADGAVLTDVEYTVTSSNKKKLSVTAAGVVTGVKAGSYTVTVTAYNGVSASCSVKVVKAPSKVAVSPAKPTIGLGQTRQLSVSFPKGGLASYTFSSNAPGVASVDANGNVTGLKLGTAVITVRTSNGKTAKATVTVSRGPDYMALNADYQLQYDPLSNAYTTVYVKAMSPGEQFQLAAENEYKTYGDIVAYESSAPSVATVNASGLITAVGPGTATITARSTSGSEAYCRVTVSGSLPAAIAFAASDATVRAGQSASMPKLRGANIDASALASAAYASSDESVLAVAWSDTDAEWKLCGVNPGTAVVTASAAGATAQLQVTVTDAAVVSSELRFESAEVDLAVGDTWKPAVYDEYGIQVSATLASDNPEAVRVDDSGALTGIAEGSALITASSGELKATMRVHVLAGASGLALNADDIQLGIGQRFTLTARMNGNDAANVGFISSDPAVASVSVGGAVIARAEGKAVITATAYGGATAACTVTVMPAPSHLSVSPASVTARLDEAGAQLSWAFGAPDEAGDVAFASSAPEVAAVSASGYITFVASGRATITATTNNGLTASIEVTVLPAKPVSTTPVYRLFAAYSYFNSTYDGYLPFSQNNVNSVADVFEKSSVSGLGYSIKVMGNPSKNQMLSGISGFFSATTDADVSIVYLCSHGHMTNGYGGYRLSLPGYDGNPNNANYYITAQEIFNCVSRINGSVVLILDSCYSGAFLQDMNDQLDAQGGRIGVLTAASDTRATYYKVKDANRSVDYFTFFLLKGLGYNDRDHWWNSNAKGSKGSYPGYLAADVAGNGDGIVTLGEFYNYASNSIAANIPSYMKKSWYWGDKSRVQVPRYYSGSLNDLVIYQPR